MAQTLASNVDLAKRGYDLFAQGDIETLASELFAADIEWIEPASLPDGGTHRGPEAVVQNVFGKVEATWGPDMSIDVERFIDGGDDVTVLGRFKGTSPVSGAPYEVPCCHVMRFKEGRMTHFQNFTDTATSLKAISA